MAESQKVRIFADMKYYLLASMPFFVCATLTALMLLELAQRPRRALTALTVFMGAATLLYFGHCVFFCRETQLIPLTDTLYCFCNPLVYPLYYIYVKQLTSLHTPRWQLAALVAPALLCGTAVGVLYWLMSAEETARFIDGYLYLHQRMDGGLTGWQQAAHRAVQVLFAVEVVAVLWLGIRRIRHYDRQLACLYSSPEDKQLTWVKLMLIVFSATSAVSLVSNMVGRYRFTDDVALLVIPSTVFTLLLFTIGYTGLKQKGIEELSDEAEEPLVSTEELPVSTEEPQTGQTTTPTEPQAAENVAGREPLKQQIERLMREEHLYLDPQLKLADLVLRLGSNRNYVYQAINVEMGMSFSEYVNRMRVEYAEQLLQSHPTMTLVEVAERSGFASSTSFYRNFKLLRGCSPKEAVARQR